MANGSSPLSFEAYVKKYAHQPGWEFLDGRACRKPVPAFLHGLLAILISDLLRLAGYYSAVEVDIRLTPDWTPRPDACAMLASPLQVKYPTSVDIVCEVLSESEDIATKCRDYAATGSVGQVFVFDGEKQTIQQWSEGNLQQVSDMLLTNDVTIPGRVIWDELQRRMQSRPTPPASKVVELP